MREVSQLLVAATYKRGCGETELLPWQLTDENVYSM